MAKIVTRLNLHDIPPADKSPSFYADDSLFITLHDFRLGSMKTGHPYRVEEGRVMMVTRGTVHVIINLQEHHLCQHALVLLMPHSIFEIIASSEDFDMQAFTFKDLPLPNSVSHIILPQLDDDEWLLVDEYVRLMWHEVHRKPILQHVLTHLQTALILELKRIDQQHQANRSTADSRHDNIFRKFLAEVNAAGLRHRNIQYYADKLCVTPNHLGAVIRKNSGLTVMQWINRHTIQEAKILLRYTDLHVCEIAERMNFANPSFFAKYFKRETGLTPREFREE